MFDKKWQDVAKNTSFAIDNREPLGKGIEEFVLGEIKGPGFDNGSNSGIYML